MDTIDPITDADFDLYWEDEAKNKNRNRIRVGRQYQATIPKLLKLGQGDERDLTQLETLCWMPHKIEDDALENYLCVAKTVKYFSKAINNHDNPAERLQTALKGLAEFVNSHHPSHHDIGCSVSKEWSPNQTKLFSQALEVCGKSPIKKDNPCQISPEPSSSSTLQDPSPSSQVQVPIKEEMSSNLGMLQFFKEGQLILELVAQKQDGDKYSWEETLATSKPGMCKKKLSQEFASVYPPVEILSREEEQHSSREGFEESASKKPRKAWSPSWTVKEEGDRIMYNPPSILQCEHCIEKQELSSPKLKGKSSCDFTRASRPPLVKHGILSKMLSSPMPCNLPGIPSPTAISSRLEELPLDLSSTKDMGHSAMDQSEDASKEDCWSQTGLNQDKASHWNLSYYELYKCLPFFSSLYPSDIPLDLSSAPSVTDKMKE